MKNLTHSMMMRINGKSFSELLADLKTNVTAFNQSRYFTKGAVDLKEAQIEINN